MIKKGKIFLNREEQRVRERMKDDVLFIFISCTDIICLHCRQVHL